MDNQSQAKLDEILKKEEAALTEGDKAFLRARESYLSADVKARYASVFEEAPATSTGESNEDSMPRGKGSKGK